MKLCKGRIKMIYQRILETLDTRENIIFCDNGGSDHTQNYDAVEGVWFDQISLRSDQVVAVLFAEDT